MHWYLKRSGISWINKSLDRRFGSDGVIHQKGDPNNK
jgi:hypothetical protein